MIKLLINTEYSESFYHYTVERVHVKSLRCITGNERNVSRNLCCLFCCIYFQCAEILPIYEDPIIAISGSYFNNRFKFFS